MIVSSVVSIVANVLNALAISFGVNPFLSTVLILQIGGYATTFVGDILFAKASFYGTEVPYGDIAERMRLLLKILFSATLTKFCITVLIDTIAVITIMRAVLVILERHGINFRFRDAIVAGVVSIGTYFLWVNTFRFNWAYSDTEDHGVNMVMIALVCLISTIFATYVVVDDSQRKCI